MTSTGACASPSLPRLLLPPAANAAQPSSREVVATSPSLEKNNDSATAHLLTRAASVLWKTFTYLARDGLLLMTKMNARAVAEIRDLSLYLASSPLLSAANALRMIAGDVGGLCHSRDARVVGEDGAYDDRDVVVDATSITSESSMASSSTSGGRHIDIVNNHGLVFEGSDLHAIGGQRRLDYVITQLDVSRMARVDTSSRNMQNDASVHVPPSSAYPVDASLILSIDTSSLILSSHEDDEQDSDAILQPTNAPVMEVYFDKSTVRNTDPSERHRRGMDDDPCQFSWMMVSSDVGEDGMTRMSASDTIGDVPVTISICKSKNNEIVKPECHDANAIVYCVTCKTPFFQDGDGISLLSCRHLLHRGFIEKSRAGGISRNAYSMCPSCEEAQRRTPSRMEDVGDCRFKESSWGIKRLGTLLSSLGSHK